MKNVPTRLEFLRKYRQLLMKEMSFVMYGVKPDYKHYLPLLKQVNKLTRKEVI